MGDLIKELLLITEAKKKKSDDEDEPKSSVTTKDLPDLKFGELGQKTDHPIQKTNKKDVKHDNDEPIGNLGRQASRERTLHAAKNAELNPRALAHLLHLVNSGISDEISDEEALRKIGLTEPVPLIPSNLPKVINKHLIKSIEPEWHMVKNLPGYMVSAIRALGRSVFKQQTKTPLEELQVLSTLTNSKAELNGVGNFARKYGKEVTKGDIDFHVMPGYSATYAIYDVLGYRLMLVRDEHGDYIYAWPQKDSK